MKDRIWTFFIFVFLGWALVNEYRDHGWQGVVVIAIVAIIAYTIAHVLIELAVRYGRRKSS